MTIHEFKIFALGVEKMIMLSHPNHIATWKNRNRYLTLMLAVIFIINADASIAQLTTVRPENCNAAAQRSLPTLQERRDELEREIARKTSVSIGKPPLTSSASRTASSDADFKKTLRANQEDLLAVIFDMAPRYFTWVA